MNIIFIEMVVFEISVIAIFICLCLKLTSRKVPVKIKVSDGGIAPDYKTDGAACADCYCRIPEGEVIIKPFETELINLGFSLEVPKGYKTVIDPRSSFLNKEHALVCHGEIDNDYRGEIKANVINLNPNELLKVVNGQRICQIQIVPVSTMDFSLADELSKTKRGAGGFGSTGQ